MSKLGPVPVVRLPQFDVIGPQRFVCRWLAEKLVTHALPTALACRIRVQRRNPKVVFDGSEHDAANVALLPTEVREAPGR